MRLVLGAIFGLLTLAGASSAQAVPELSYYSGQYASDGFRDVNVSVSGDLLVFDESRGSNGLTSVFRCYGDSCEIDSSLSSETVCQTSRIQLLKDLNFLFINTCIGRTNRFYRIGGGSGPHYPPSQPQPPHHPPRPPHHPPGPRPPAPRPPAPPVNTSAPWVISERKDPVDGQRIVRAAVTNLDGSAIYMTCKAPSPDVAMWVKVTDVLGRAISQSVTTLGEQLVIKAQINGVTHILPNWRIADTNLLVNLDRVTQAQTADLRAGYRVTLDFTSKKPTGEVLALGRMDFTLRGSAATLRDLQNRCAAAPLPGGVPDYRPIVTP